MVIDQRAQYFLAYTKYIFEFQQCYSNYCSILHFTSEVPLDFRDLVDHFEQFHVPTKFLENMIAPETWTKAWLNL